MEKSKLKWNRAFIPVIVAAVVGTVYIIATILESKYFGTHVSAWIYGGLIIIGAGWLGFGIQYRVPHFRAIIFLLGVIVGTLAWHYELANHHDTVFTDFTVLLHMGVMALAIGVLTPIMYTLKTKLESHHRRLFELIAEPIADASDGYTPRPYPAGKTDCSREEIQRFAQFMEQKYIKNNYLNDDQIILLLPGLHSPFGHIKKPNPENSSYIAFDKEGNVKAFMSQKDYDQYRDTYTFDQLCESMGTLFLGFLEDFRNGQENRILEKFRSRTWNWRAAVLIFGILLFIAALVMYLIAKYGG